MKVLHVINSLGLGGGAEHSLIAMLPEYAAHGIESEVVCLEERDHGLFETVQAMGLPYTVLPGSNMLAQARQLRSLLKNRRPDLVHATLVDASLVTRIACLGLPVPQLHSLVNATYDSSRIWNEGISRIKLGAVRRLDAWTARLIQGQFHAITEAVKRDAIDHLGIPPSRISVIPRGRSATTLGSRTAARRAAVRERMGCRPDDIVVLNVGRQDRIKAQELVIRSFDQAARRDSRLQLWIVGREGNASVAVAVAKSSAISGERIRLLGHRADVSDLLCAADLLVAFSHYEGFGGVLIEAMALECPIVASDADCFTEVLENGRLGVLTPRGDTDALQRTLATLASATDLRHKYALRGLTAYREKYEIANSAESMIRLYETMSSASDGWRA